MNSRARLAATVLFALLTASCAGTRHSGHVGVTSLDSDSYEPVDQQFTLGWSMSQDVEQSGLTYEAGLMAGRDTGTVQGLDVASTNVELYGGPRFEFVLDEVRPYLAGGVSLLSSEVEVSQGGLTLSTDDDSLGFYLGGGVDIDVNESMFFGVGARQSFAHEITVGGQDFEADFTQVFVRIGTSF